MSCKLITLFLLFEVVVICVNAGRINQNGTLLEREIFRKNESAVETFVLLNPKQIQRMESTMQVFLASLIGPVAQPITLRLSSPNRSDLQQTIRETSGTIRAQIIEFARARGFVAPIRQREQISWNSTVSEDWFSETLLQLSLLLYDLLSVGEEAWFRINHYLDINNATLRENKKSSSHKETKSFEFLSTVNDVTRLNEKLFKCLSSITDRKNRASYFDLNRAFADLARGPPNSTMKMFKTGLDRALVHYAPNDETSGKQLHELLCYSLAKKNRNYNDCVKEFRRVKSCVLSTKRNSVKVIANNQRKSFLKTFIKKLIRHLTSIINIITSFLTFTDFMRNNSNRNSNCNFDRILPRTTVQQVKYIYENILDRQISRHSPLYHAANELGNTLSRSRWGRQLTRDICQYFEIYRKGRKILDKISRQAVRDRKAAIRYKEIRNLPKLYKNALLKETTIVVGNFHRSALETQTFLINIRKQANNAFEKLLQSMNRVSRVRSVSSKSTLACLANNLMLVTMFMKTVGLVSTLFCMDNSQNQFNSEDIEESKENWISNEQSTTVDYYP